MSGGKRPFDLGFADQARREFLGLPRELRIRAERVMKALEEDPVLRWPGADIKVLTQTGTVVLRRIRFGDHRALYVVLPEGRMVIVLVVDARSAGYAHLMRTASERLKRFPGDLLP